MNSPSEGKKEVSNFTWTLFILETVSKYSNSDVKIGFFIRKEEVYAVFQL